MNALLAPAFLFGTGVDEWALLGVIVFLLFGPRRLPEIARSIGRTVAKFRLAADEFREQLAHMDDPPPAMSAPPSQELSGTHADAGGPARSELRLPSVDTSQQDARV
ncbi:MAG: twin-arginine translocase TatA/TatE family subunit [bacterium]